MRSSLFRNVSDEAVSSVVSAVLVVTLFSAAFGVWTVETMPEWIKDREDAHARGVGTSMGAASSDILATAGTGRTGATIMSVPLAPDKIALLQQAPATGSLEVTPGFGYKFSAPDGHALVMSGGAMRVATPFASTALNDVQSLIAMDWALSTGATLEATGAGNAVVTATASDCTSSVRTITITATGASRQATVPCTGNDVVNMLDDQIRFGAFLQGLQTPMSFDAATVSAVWIGSDGLTRKAPANPTSIGGWAEEKTGLGSLVFTPSYRELDERKVVMEGGAVINIQEGGSVMSSSPPAKLTVKNIGGTNTGSLRWTLLTFSGDGGLTGSSAARASFTVTSTTERVLHLPTGGTDATLDVTSQAPAAWAAAWNDAATVGNLGATHYATSTAGSDATLTLKSSIPWTIHLTIVHVDVRVT